MLTNAYFKKELLKCLLTLAIARIIVQSFELFIKHNAIIEIKLLTMEIKMLIVTNIKFTFVSKYRTIPDRPAFLPVFELL